MNDAVIPVCAFRAEESQHVTNQISITDRVTKAQENCIGFFRSKQVSRNENVEKIYLTKARYGILSLASEV